MVQGGPVRPVSSSRGLRHSVSRVCDWTLVWSDQRVRSVHLGAEERRVTSASEGPRDQSFRSGTQRSRAWCGADQTPGAARPVI
jgi:hypothetical protein